MPQPDKIVVISQLMYFVTGMHKVLAPIFQGTGIIKTNILQVAYNEICFTAYGISHPANRRQTAAGKHIAFDKIHFAHILLITLVNNSNSLQNHNALWR